jgi:hypothetical protein
MVLAHGEKTNLNDPLLQHIQLRLTENKFLTLRFNFPFAEGRRRKSPDDTAVLQRAFRAAIALLGRDPTATPAHLFLGGVGLGARIAASLAADLITIEGICLFGYPLHAADNPQTIEADPLFRIVSPMLFLQGTEDPTCNIQLLQRTMSRVGAPTSLCAFEKVGQNFAQLEERQEGQEPLLDEVFASITEWLGQVLREE